MGRVLMNTPGVQLYNKVLDRFTNESAEQFIGDLVEDLNAGKGFVPFVGAGFSVAAGAPLTWDLQKYLQKCLFLALRADGGERWQPRRHRWPDFVQTTYALKQGLDDLKRDYEHLSSESPEQERRLFQEAIGAAADWRSSLLFLSRLDCDDDSLYLGAPRQEVIDACIRAAMSGRSPGLPHRMLAVLAGALRMDVILTTNFDDLLERAFGEARNRLEVHSVPLRSDLPAIELLAGQRALVKLHGTGHGLRADYSLDERPSESDRRTFVEYLATPLPDRGVPRTARNHLLMFGFSGNDRRIQGFIRHAWSAIEGLVVYWVCFSAKDVRKVEALARRAFGEVPEKALAERPPLRILQCKHIGLLLLQVYQHLRHSLPATGCPFPSISRIPTAPLHRDDPGVDPANPGPCTPAGAPPSSAADIQAAILERQKDTWRKRRLIVIVGEKNGMTSDVGSIFWNLYDQHTSLWIDMNDVSGVDNLYETLLESFLYQVGVEHWTPAFDDKADDQLRIQELHRIARYTGKRWIVYLNARETPGANLGKVEATRPNNGWLDGTSPEVSRFAGFVSALTKSVSLGFDETDHPVSVVLLLRGAAGNLPAVATRLKRGGNEIKEHHGHNEDKPTQAAKNAIERASAPHAKTFLRYLVHSQRPRLAAIRWALPERTMTSAGLDDLDNREEWDRQVQEFLKETSTQQPDVLRHKPGGFIWLHCLTREVLRSKLESVQDDHRIHAALANWYRQVLDASNAPAAVFECVYHCAMSAALLLRMSRDPRGAPERSKCCQEATARLREATVMLQTHAGLIQTQSYSRGSCRKLESTRRLYEQDLGNLDDQERPFSDAWFELALVCTDLMRAVAREVGEDGKAYQRHREALRLMVGRDSGHSVAQVIREMNDDIGEKPTSRALFNALEGRSDTVSSAAQWLRWHRWCGMLGNISRSYKRARSAIDRCLQFAVDGAYLGPRSATTGPRFDIEAFDPASMGTEFFGKPVAALNGMRTIHVEALRALEQYVEIRMHRATLLQRLNALDGDECEGRSTQRDAEIGRLRREAMSGIGKSREWIRQILSHEGNESDLVRAIWAKTRFLQHEAVLVIGCSGPSGIEESFRLLSEAEACQRVTRHRFPSELANVEIRRAETKIAMAENEMIGSLTFIEACSQALASDQLKPLRSLDEAKRAKIDRCLTDAVRFLDRAEPILRERRRNVWWTTLLFERRLHISSLRLWASLAAKEDPVPDVGIEVAPEGIKTRPELLLEDAIRMVRIDNLRLAYIVNAFSSCVKAFQARGGPELPEIPWHDRRGVQLNAALARALDRLEDVHRRRQHVDPTGIVEENWRQDPEVAEFVNNVLKRNGRVVLSEAPDEKPESAVGTDQSSPQT